jgi:hypothetical protein
MMRVKRCEVRIIVRDPWLIDDPEVLVRAVTGLIFDLVLPRIEAQLERVGSPAVPSIALRIAIPISAVPDYTAQAAGGLQSIRTGRFRDAALSTSRPHTAGPAGINSSDVVITLGEEISRSVHDALTTVAMQPGSAPIGDSVSGILVRSVICTLAKASRSGWLPLALAWAGPDTVLTWTTLLATVPDSTAYLYAGFGTGDPRDGAIGEGTALSAMTGGPISERPDESEVQARRSPESLASIKGTAAGYDLTNLMSGSGRFGDNRRATSRGESDSAAFRSPVGQAVAAAITELEQVVDSGSLHLAVAVAAAERLAVSASDQTVWEAMLLQIGTPLSPPSKSLSSDIRPKMSDDRGLDGTGRGGIEEGAYAEVGQRGTFGSTVPDRRSAYCVVGEADLVSVLPFLILGPLQRLGLLDVAAAFLAEAGTSSPLAGFAAGIARKVLPQSVNGWQEHKRLANTVAALAGLPEAPNGATLDRVAAAAPRWWPVMRRTLVEDMISDRPCTLPLLVATAESGTALADSQGVFPLASGGTVEEARELWRAFGRPPLIAPDGTSLFSAGEAITISNDEASVEPLTKWMDAMAERPASGRKGLVPELDGPLDVLAGAGLASIAWQLWHESETTHPLLALSRFEDLDGHVNFGAERITVRMPLGRRHADLRDSGLLETLRDVPWFAGRPLEFTGG